MTRFGRRRFLTGAGVAGGALIAGPLPARAASDTPADYPDGPFHCSTASLAERLNEFWAIYGTGQGTPQTQGALSAGALTVMGLNPAWDEWDALKFAWTAQRGNRATLMNALGSDSHRINGVGGTTGTQPAGYLWSWADLETWPDNNAFHSGLGSFHFDQLPRFVSAVARLACWTRDPQFIAHLLPRVEAVMDRYLLGTLAGNRGVLTTPSSQPNGTHSDGTAAGRPGNYMDEMRAGYRDGWINAAFYTALQAMADLQELAGRPGERYRRRADKFVQHYSDAFWNSDTGRYTGWVDAAGQPHDYGLTFVSLEALARGLATDTQAAAVFRFLHNPAEPTSAIPKPACSYFASAHPGSTDVYQVVFGPRLTTVRLPDSAWDGWSDASCGRRPYGSGVEEGGSVLWLVNYDVLARLRHIDADAALSRLTTMLARMESDSQRLTLWGGRAFDDFGESVVEIGTNSPFPESGISATPFVYGFVGLTATPSALEIAPQLPHSVHAASVDGVSYAGKEFTVSVSRATVRAEQPAAAALVPADQLTGPAFRANGPFDQIAILTGGAVPAAGTVTLTVEREFGARWQPLLTRANFAVVDRDWLVIDLPKQPGGDRYRVRLTGGSPGTGWYSNSAGELTFRVLDSAHESLSAQVHGQRLRAAMPFDRLVFRCATASTSVLLSRIVGGERVTRITHQFTDIARQGEFVCGFAEQKAGDYELVVPPGTTLQRIERPVYTIAIPQLDIRVDSPAGAAYRLIPG